MTLDKRSPETLQTVDVKIRVPELPESAPFWIRDYAAHCTFQELREECINHAEVRRFQHQLARVPASRHFWCGDQMLRDDQPLASIASRLESIGGRPGISLVLRRDYYRIVPSQYVANGLEYRYVNPESPIAQVIPRILNKDERACCFDLCSYRRRRLAQEKSLADYALWPAWEDAQDEPFPERALLQLRPHISWLPYMLLAGAVLLGGLTGYLLIGMLLSFS